MAVARIRATGDCSAASPGARALIVPAKAFTISHLAMHYRPLQRRRHYDNRAKALLCITIFSALVVSATQLVNRVHENADILRRRVLRNPVTEIEHVA
jgi:hypothetical protein